MLLRKVAQNVSASRRADVKADDLPFALGVRGHGDYRRDRDDAAALALLQVGRVQPQIGPLAVERAVEEGADPLVDVLAELADGALGDPGQPHRLHQVVDAPGRDAADPGFLDHRHQGLLRRLPGLEEGREVAALPQLGDAQLQAAQPGVERRGPGSRCGRSCASPDRSCRPAPIRPSTSVSISSCTTASATLRRKSPSPAFASSSASGSLSSVIGSSRLQGEASQLHLSQPIRWPPPPTPSRAPNFHHSRGRYRSSRGGRPRSCWPRRISTTTRRTAARRHRNVKALCQRCHLLHDRPEHRRRIRLTLRRRKALGDLFSGMYSPW